MKELSNYRYGFIKRKEESLTKLNSFREEFMKKKKEIVEDLEEATIIWKETSEILEKKKQKIKKGE